MGNTIKILIDRWKKGINTELFELTQTLGTISTANELINALGGGLVVGDITDFTYNGITHDVSCKITKDYILKTNAFFTDNNTITIKDYGRCIGFLDNAFWNAANITDIYFENAAYVGIRAFRGCTNVTSINMPNLTDVNGSDCFRSMSSSPTVYMPNCVIIGATVGNEGNFISSNNCIITVDATLETINGGGREGDIANAEDTYSCTIIYD